MGFHFWKLPEHSFQFAQQSEAKSCVFCFIIIIICNENTVITPSRVEVCSYLDSPEDKWILNIHSTYSNLLLWIVKQSSR